MIEIITTPEQIESKPVKLTHKTVCYYSHYLKSFIDEHGEKTANPLKLKAQKFIKNKCIRYDKEFKCYYCDPIQGYNQRIYKMVCKNKKWSCCCQGYRKNNYCSHIMSLMLFFKMVNWK